eukprot:2013043-Pyramimonas_sp.AAC.1
MGTGGPVACAESRSASRSAGIAAPNGEWVMAQASTRAAVVSALHRSKGSVSSPCASASSRGISCGTCYIIITIIIIIIIIINQG